MHNDMVVCVVTAADRFHFDRVYMDLYMQQAVHHSDPGQVDTLGQGDFQAAVVVQYAQPLRNFCILTIAEAEECQFFL